MKVLVSEFTRKGKCLSSSDVDLRSRRARKHLGDLPDFPWCETVNKPTSETEGLLSSVDEQRDHFIAMLIHVLALAALFEAFEAPMARVAQTAMKAAAPALVAGALVMGDAGTAFAANAAVGERIFDGNCAACHAGGTNVILPQKTLEKEVRSPAPSLPSLPHIAPD